MIEPFLNEIPSSPLIDGDQNALAIPSISERSLLDALPLIQLIIRRRRVSFQYSDVSDLVQGIALRLWRWQDKNREKSDSMSGEEWSSYAARTAYNEVNRHLSKSAAGVAISEDIADKSAVASIEGNSEVEVFSLILAAWQEISGLSLRQRRALVLHSQELIVYFLQSGKDDEDLARMLEFEIAEWNDIRNRIPLSDVQIAEVTKDADENRTPETIARSIKKARYDARKKLEGVGSK